MDSEAHDDASSSPSADRIERISEGSRRRCRVHLLSGSSFFVPIKSCVDLGLSVGAAVGRDLREELRTAEELGDAYDKAIDLLARRDHSIRQLQLKLVKRRFERTVVDAVCDSLKDEGYLDDTAFACRWLEQRIASHHEGRTRLMSGLARAGVSRVEAIQAIDTVLDAEYEERAFESATASLEARGIADHARIARRLSSLGFAAERIRGYLEQISHRN